MTDGILASAVLLKKRIRASFCCCFCGRRNRGFEVSHSENSVTRWHNHHHQELHKSQHPSPEPRGPDLSTRFSHATGTVYTLVLYQEAPTYPLALATPQELSTLWFCTGRQSSITDVLSPFKNCCENPMRQGTCKLFGRALQVALHHPCQAHVLSRKAALLSTPIYYRYYSLVTTYTWQWPTMFPHPFPSANLCPYPTD